jgi:hypothetical protein
MMPSGAGDHVAHQVHAPRHRHQLSSQVLNRSPAFSPFAAHQSKS